MNLDKESINMVRKNKSEIIKALLDSSVIAVIRMQDPTKTKHVIEALHLGGINCIEITMTVPGAVELISNFSKTMPTDIIIGAGTVTNDSVAETVIEAGAQFVVSPILNLNIIKTCKKFNIVCIPGCFTPTEIFTAREAGADIIKVFPARSLGPRFLKDIAGPFPDIKLMPTGGITVENVGEWISAGAAGVGIGSELLDKTAIAEERYEILTEKAKTLVKNIKLAKGK